MKQNVIRRTLGNGLEIAVEPMPQFGSVSLGFWMKRGSRHEPAVHAGVTHMIEHLLFKGTKSLSCEQIAEQIDVVGGNVDAFTSRESTSYVAKVRDLHLDATFSLLTSLLREPRFDEDDIGKEREVILEELRMVHDTPDDLAQENFHAAFYPDHPLGRSILGDEASLERIGGGEVRAWYEEHYLNPANFILTAAGNVSAEDFIYRAEEAFQGLESSECNHTAKPETIGSGLHVVKRRRLEQVQLMLGFPAYPATDERRHALEVLAAYLGGSMSSRLFQEIRERRGLAYTIQAFTSSFHDSGFMAIYAATGPERLNQLLSVLEAELRAVLENGLEAAALERVKAMLETEMVLGMEGSYSRMGLMARQLQYFGELRPFETILEELRAVDRQAVRHVASDVLGGHQPLLSVLGPVDDDIREIRIG